MRNNVMRNVRWMRRYACRCETLMAMAFASSFYIYCKWKESKPHVSDANSRDTAAAAGHKNHQQQQHFKLTQIWQQYYRLFAATVTAPPTISTVLDNNKHAIIDNDAHNEDSPSTSGQFFETGFQQQAKARNDDKNGPWFYTRDNIAVYAVRGRRPTMEDRFNIADNLSPDRNVLGFAVYDGHGGPFVADYAEKHVLPSVLRHVSQKLKQKDPINMTEILINEIVRHDEKLMEEGGTAQDLSGSTALVGVLHQQKLYIANVGDCRAVSTKPRKLDEALQITMDHKPNEERELTRIKDAGGFVAFNGVWRVGGVLAVSRALGDGYLKKRGWLTAVPDVYVIDLNRLPLPYVILASDGLWDVFSSQEAVDFVSPYVNTEKFFGAKQLAEKAVKKGSNDNVTVMIIKFNTQDSAT